MPAYYESWSANTRRRQPRRSCRRSLATGRSISTSSTSPASYISDQHTRPPSLLSFSPNLRPTDPSLSPSAYSRHPTRRPTSAIVDNHLQVPSAVACNTNNLSPGAWRHSISALNASGHPCAADGIPHWPPSHSGSSGGRQLLNRVHANIERINGEIDGDEDSEDDDDDDDYNSEDDNEDEEGETYKYATGSHSQTHDLEQGCNTLSPLHGDSSKKQYQSRHSLSVPTSNIHLSTPRRTPTSVNTPTHTRTASLPSTDHPHFTTPNTRSTLYPHSNQQKHPLTPTGRRSVSGRARPWSQVIWESPASSQHGIELSGVPRSPVTTPWLLPASYGAPAIRTGPSSESNLLKVPVDRSLVESSLTQPRQAPSSYPAMPPDLFHRQPHRESQRVCSALNGSDYSPTFLQHRLPKELGSQGAVKKRGHRVSLGTTYYASLLSPVTASVPGSSNYGRSPTTPKLSQMVRLPARPQSVLIPVSPRLLRSAQQQHGHRATLAYPWQYSPTIASSPPRAGKHMRSNSAAPSMTTKNATTTPVMRVIPPLWHPLVGLGPSANAHTFPGTAETPDLEMGDDTSNYENAIANKEANIHPKNPVPSPLLTKPPERPCGGHGASSSQRRHTPTSLAKLLPTLFESSSAVSCKTTDGTLGQPSIHSFIWSSSSSSLSSPWSVPTSGASSAERLVPPAPVGLQGNNSRGRLSAFSIQPKKPTTRPGTPSTTTTTTTTTSRWPLRTSRQSSSHLRLGSKRFSFFVPTSKTSSSASSHRVSGIVRRAPSLPLQPTLTTSRPSSGIGRGIGGGASSSLFPFSLVTYETGGLLGELKHTSTAVCTHAASSVVAPGTPVPAGVCVVTGTPPPTGSGAYLPPLGAATSSPMRESLLHSSQVLAYRHRSSASSSSSCNSHSSRRDAIAADADDRQFLQNLMGRMSHYNRYEEKGSAVATWADYLDDSVVLQTSHVAIYEINGRWGSRLLMFLLLVFGILCVLAGGFCTEAYCKDLSLCSDDYTPWHSPHHSRGWCGPSGIEGAPYLLSMGLSMTIFGFYALYHLRAPMSRLVGYSEIDQFLQ